MRRVLLAVAVVLFVIDGFVALGDVSAKYELALVPFGLAFGFGAFLV